MIAPVRHRFSVVDYHRMAESGVLPAGARVELLDGQILDMSPIGPFHGGVTNFLNQTFATEARGRWLVSVQNPVRLDDHSEPQPDLLLLRPAADFYRRRHPQPEDVLLLVEVSDTTIGTDQEEKLPAYGRAGIPEVWLVNLNDLTVEVYREPHFTGYATKTVLRRGEVARPTACPEVGIDVAELLRR